MPGGNLMADLHNKLAMRRKGISGAKEMASTTIPIESSSSSGNRPTNVMDRLSAMIPPPPTKQQPNSSTTDASDDDWD